MQVSRPVLAVRQSNINRVPVLATPTCAPGARMLELSCNVMPLAKLLVHKRGSPATVSASKMRLSPMRCKPIPSPNRVSPDAGEIEVTHACVPLS